jgi:hypothetical protein
VALTILCCYYAAREVNRNYGPAAAALTMYLMYVYYRQFIGSTLTESLGLAFGALSLGFLLWGARTHSFRITLCGLFLASLALNVRPGPLFILVLLVVWFAFTFRRSKTLAGLARPFLAGSGVILLAFAINFIMIKALSTPGAALFSRFPPTFYGLVVGGKDWVQVYEDYPAVLKLPAAQQSAAIYAYALDAIRANPGRFAKGISNFFLDFFSAKRGAFTFIHDEMFIRWALFFLSFLGIVFLTLKRKDSRSTLLLAGLAGIVLSTPFVPSRDSNWMRTYGAVIPFIVIIPSLSLALFTPGGIAVDEEDLEDEENAFRSPGFILPALLVVSVIAGPFIVKAFTQPPMVKPLVCGPSDTAYAVRINPGSYIRVIADDAAAESRLPDMRISDLLHSVQTFDYQYVFAQLPYRPGMTLLNTLDLVSREKVWIAVPSVDLPVDGSIVQVCGQRVDGSIFIFASGLVPPENR